MTISFLCLSAAHLCAPPAYNFVRAGETLRCAGTNNVFTHRSVVSTRRRALAGGRLCDAKHTYAEIFFLPTARREFLEIP